MELSEEQFARDQVQLLGRHRRETQPTDCIMTYSTIFAVESFRCAFSSCFFCLIFLDMGLARNQAIREIRQERHQERQAINEAQPVEESYQGPYNNPPQTYQEWDFEGSAGYSGLELPSGPPNNYPPAQLSTVQPNFFSSLTAQAGGNHVSDGWQIYSSSNIRDSW
jgi:hypothetical protein